MLESLNVIIDDVRLRADRPLVLLVDGLDKLRDLDVIRLNFLEKKFLTRLWPFSLQRDSRKMAAR